MKIIPIDHIDDIEDIEISKIPIVGSRILYVKYI
jgi:hypothetical protein